MKPRSFFLSMLALALILSGGVWLAGQARAQAPGEPITLGPSPEAALGNAFTYQGRLLDGGTPVDGACDFEFSLWDDPSAGSQIGTTQSKSGVTVSDGYFGVSLDFGVAAFQGEARYLDITVDCGGGSTPLSPRVTLSGTPYAHSLRPGASVSSSTGIALNLSTSATSGSALRAMASASSGNAAAVYGESSAPDGAGLSGYNSGGGYGVYGGTPNGVGVYGLASATTGITVGVLGESESDEGVGVHGKAHAPTGTTYGVYGVSNSSAGTGVYGSAPTTGTVGIATGSGGYGVYGESASGHGVHGKATPPDGYALYSEGNTHIEGELSWLGKTSYVAVSAAAFRPFDENHMFANWGNMLTPQNISSAYYYAPVQLPHGALVTRVKFYWYDASADYSGTTILHRNDLASNPVQMATVSSTGSSGDGWSETTNITDPTIDNSQYAYYIEWELGGGPDVSGYAVIIEYVLYGPY